MALKVIEGGVEALGAVTAMVAEAGAAGTLWTFARFRRDKRKSVTLENVAADAAIGARMTLNDAGRFAFYSHGGQWILCGFSRAATIEIASVANDPAAIAADAIRTPAKRKMLLGVALCFTIIGLFFAFDMIKAGRATLRANPAPKRPSDKRLTRALKGQLFWPF